MHLLSSPTRRKPSPAVRAESIALVNLHALRISRRAIMHAKALLHAHRNTKIPVTGARWMDQTESFRRQPLYHVQCRQHCGPLLRNFSQRTTSNNILTRPKRTRSGCLHYYDIATDETRPSDLTRPRLPYHYLEYVDPEPLATIHDVQLQVRDSKGGT